MFLRRVVVGASAANLAYLMVWDTLLQARAPDAFYLFMTRTDFLAATLSIALCGIACGAVGWIVDRTKQRWVSFIADLGAFIAALIILNVLRQYLRLTPNAAGQWVSALGRTGSAALALAVAITLVVTALVWRRRAVQALFLAGLALSPFLVITFGRAAWICTHVDIDRRFAPRSPAAPVVDALRPGRRVVLIVFDELDYRLAFAERPAGLALPAFDALLRESVVANHAEPPAGNTNEAIPSYLIGRRVQRTISSSAREGRLVIKGTHDSLSTDSVTTLFRRARSLGANSGMIGWNLPFCRTGLGDGLVRCEWWPSGLLLGRAESLGRTMLHQWISISPVNSRAIHWIRHDEMMAGALALVADPSLDLVVLHLAVPHYPWIYNAVGGRYTVMEFGARGYLGNLALADADLGALRTALESSGLNEETSLVVTSDHPWRESRTFDGRSDPRVPLIVHLSKARGGSTVLGPFNTVVTGDLCLALLAGSLNSADSVPAWLAAHAAAGVRR